MGVGLSKLSTLVAMQIVLIVDSSKYPLCVYDLMEYMFSEQYKEHRLRKPPKIVSDIINDYWKRGWKVNAVFHPEHGWFIIEVPGVIVGWWKLGG